jgi:hypothetical protein
LLETQCGEVIQTTPPYGEPAEAVDGALVSYAFTRTELTVGASYKAGGPLTIAAPTVAGMPDFDHVHTLVYRHNPLSIDAPDIMLNGVLLAQVNSTTTDQSVQAISALNTVLTQAAATQTALSAAATKAPIKTAMVVSTKPTCGDDTQVSLTRDITYGHSYSLVVQQSSKDCTIDLQVQSGPPYTVLGFVGYPRNDDVRPTEDYCNLAVCFRLTAGYNVTITALLRTTGGAPASVKQTVTQQVIGASRYDVGYVHFNRRAFTANMTQITFTQGLVSEFKSSDPSEVVGFLALPAAALATAALIK